MFARTVVLVLWVFQMFSPWIWCLCWFFFSIVPPTALEDAVRHIISYNNVFHNRGKNNTNIKDAKENTPKKSLVPLLREGGGNKLFLGCVFFRIKKKRTFPPHVRTEKKQFSLLVGFFVVFCVWWAVRSLVLCFWIKLVEEFFLAVVFFSPRTADVMWPYPQKKKKRKPHRWGWTYINGIEKTTTWVETPHLSSR